MPHCLIISSYNLIIKLRFFDHTLFINNAEQNTFLFDLLYTGIVIFQK